MYLKMTKFVTESAKTEQHNSTMQIFQYKALNMLGKWMHILKKIVQLYTLCSCQQLKTGYHFICPSNRNLKIFVSLQCTKGIVSYGRLFTWRQSIYSRLMFLHGFQLCLWWCRRVEGITYPVIHSSVDGKHDGANFEFVHHSICKLHPF